MTCGIYKLEAENGDFYIGSSVNIERRWTEHNSRGHKGLARSVLIICKPEHRRLYELRCIHYLKPTLNKSPWVIGAHSEEVRAKISAKMRGRKLTPEQLAKLSAGMKGRQFSEEHRRKIGAAHYCRVKVTCRQCGAQFEVIPSAVGTKKFCGKKCYHKSLSGSRHKPETLAKMSATRKRLWLDVPRAPKIKEAKKPRVMSEATKEKLRALAIGRRHTAEAKAKMSAQRKGKSPSAEHRANLSKALKGRIVSEERKEKRRLQPPPTLGKRHSEATKVRMSETRKAIWLNAEYRHKVIAGVRAARASARCS